MAPRTASFSLTTRQKNRFDTKMANARKNQDDEKKIEAIINEAVEDFYHTSDTTINVEATQKDHTDGVITITHSDGDGLFGEATSTYRILIETKVGKDFSGNKRDIAEVVSQVLWYLRDARERGDIIPEVSIIADDNEIFFLPTSVIRNYLDGDYHWEYSASSMSRDTELMDALVADANINPYVHDITVDHFDIGLFLGDVTSTLYNTTELTRIQPTVDNMTKLFMDFNHDVFGGVFEPVDNQTQLKAFFLGIQGSDELGFHPKKKDVLMVGGDDIQLPSHHAARAFEYFFNHIDTNMTHAELKELSEIFDQGIIHDKMRRFHGDFFTPKIWVDQAHRVIEDALGGDWRDNYVVVDPACGTKNLTRDYDFAELYSMTLHQEELDVSEGYNVGEKCIAEQYDFLNDDVLVMHGGGVERPTKGGKKALAAWEEGRFSREQVWALSQAGALKMPAGLVQALYEKKPIVFFANPPYGQATSEIGREHKVGVSSTYLRGVMPKNYGHAKQELYTQFIYRVQLLAELFGYEEDFHFFFFNKGFLTSPSFGSFTKSLTSDFTFRDGFLMNAGEFSGTSSAWGITFSHWEIGGSNQREFDYLVMESVDGGGISETGVWKAQMVDKGETISDWLAEIAISDTIDINAPITRNGLDSPASTPRLTMTEGWVGYLGNNGYNVQYSDKYVYCASGGVGRANGRQVSRENFLRAALTFSVRRSVQEDIALHNRLWIQDKDIFRAPSSTLSDDDTFLIDCLVYSLFDKQSRQTSLRNYTYNGKTYAITNEFFPWSSDSIKQLAISAIKDKGLTDFRDVEQDVDLHGKKERLVHTTLEKARKDGNLSAEAQALLDASWKLVEESFNDRLDHAHQQPRYQSANWDAGWLQIRSMLWGRDRISDDYLDEKPSWDEKLRALGDKIAQRAYADGIIGAPDDGVSAAAEPAIEDDSPTDTTQDVSTS